MSHLMVGGHAATAKQEHTQRKPGADDSTAAGWQVLAPPSFSLPEFWHDLRHHWERDLRGQPAGRRVAFLILRILQHAGYHQGYGTDRTLRAFPPPCHPDFTSMERNLDQLPVEIRLEWLHAFMGHFSNPDAEAAIPHPDSVVFELSGNCNYNCQGCGRGALGIASERFMKPQDLRRWAAVACTNARLIRINGLGESTLHPEFRKCVETLAHYPGGREIITNGSAPLDTYERLLARNYVLLISWDAADAEHFALIRRGADFRTMVDKVRHIAAIARRHNAPRPVLLFTLRPENLDQLDATVRLAGRVGVDRLTVNMLKQAHNLDWTLGLREQIKAIFERAALTARDHDVDLAVPDHVGRSPVEVAGARKTSSCHCEFPWTQVVIRHNGEVTPCNMLNPYSYGNIQDRPFDEVWNDAEAKVFRQYSGTHWRHPFCKDCYFIKVAERADEGPAAAPDLVVHRGL